MVCTYLTVGNMATRTNVLVLFLSKRMVDINTHFLNNAGMHFLTPQSFGNRLWSFRGKLPAVYFYGDIVVLEEW